MTVTNAEPISQTELRALADFAEREAAVNERRAAELLLNGTAADETDARTFYNGAASFSTQAADFRSRIEVLKEPLTYRQGSSVSYFADLARAAQGHPAAGDRLARHATEMDVELAARDERARRALPDGVNLEYRTNPNRLPGQGGNFSPPLWLIDEFAPAPRPMRVLADLIPRFEMPRGTSSVNIPKVTTGQTVATVQDLGTTSSTDLTDTFVSSPVVTLAGRADVAMQLLEQSPGGSYLDHAFFQDLTQDYDFKLEQQLVNGSGSAGQLQGVIPAAANTITYTDATPTGPRLFPLLGQTIATVANARKAMPTAWLLTGSRLAWIATSEDSAGLPLIVQGVDGDGDADVSLATVSAYTDEALPRNLGAGTNQEIIVACRPEDMMLFESAPRATVAFEPLSGTLQARLQLHNPVAALVARRPNGIAVIQGTGLIVAASF
jgi:HK97 family phage major capsid protein